MYLLSFLRFWTLSLEWFLIFILIYFEWHDTENQQLVELGSAHVKYGVLPRP